MEKIKIKGTGWQFPKRYYPADIVEESGDDSITSMVYHAVRKCLDDAGEEMSAIDAIVTASVDLHDGKTASNISITEVVGAVMKPETRIAGDSLLALAHGAMTISSGQYNKVLVVAHGKASEGDSEKISNWAFDPIFQQPLGLTNSIALGLQSQAFLGRCPAIIGDEKARADMVTRFFAGDSSLKESPFAAKGLTSEDVLNTPISIDPLHELEVAQVGDGAAAILLEGGISDGIELQGFGYSLDRHYLGDRDLSRSESLTKAVAGAAKMAGMDQIKDKIDRYYWSLSSSLQLPLWAEAAGVWDFNDGLEALLNKSIHNSGDNSTAHPGANTWNNLPPIAIGLQRLIAAVKDLKGQATGDCALVQGCYGAAGQSQVVCLIK